MSGVIPGFPGMGRRSSRQAVPTASVATRRQKLAAPGFSSWKAISQRPGVPDKEFQGSRTPHLLPARGADNEELAHDPRLAGQPTDQGKARESWATANQVAAPVGIIEVGGQPARFVQPLAVWHRTPKLRQVMCIQLPQPLDHDALFSGHQS